MAFQTQSYATQALGNPGEISKAFHNFANTEAIICADDKVQVGGFVQSKVSGATAENEVVGATGQAITGRILGVVIKDHYTSECVSNGATLLYPKGNYATIATSGNVFISCDGVAKKGQFVQLVTASGALEFSDTMWVENNTFTGWIVSKGNDSGAGIIEITTSGANTIATQPTSAES